MGEPVNIYPTENRIYIGGLVGEPAVDPSKIGSKSWVHLLDPQKKDLRVVTRYDFHSQNIRTVHGKEHRYLIEVLLQVVQGDPASRF